MDKRVYLHSIADPTVADALMGRLIHRAHTIELRGDSMRKRENNSTKAD